MKHMNEISYTEIDIRPKGTRINQMYKSQTQDLPWRSIQTPPAASIQKYYWIYSVQYTSV